MVIPWASRLGVGRGVVYPILKKEKPCYWNCNKDLVPVVCLNGEYMTFKSKMCRTIVFLYLLLSRTVLQQEQQVPCMKVGRLSMVTIQQRVNVICICSNDGNAEGWFFFFFSYIFIYTYNRYYRNINVFILWWWAIEMSLSTSSGVINCNAIPSGWYHCTVCSCCFHCDFVNGKWIMDNVFI